MTEREPIYDVDVRGRGTGFDLSLAGALAYAKTHDGTVMVSYDGGQTWERYEPDDT
ncbi:hypothetical protein [Nonomuraea rubra]|uniref:Photosystem II stability/assembly factor-like uncharacterized protein n=1 Tax=Nonomuraea rubra TaxID=46180 RepID=A0A7X0U5N3_9ACTN|nr:hypothetical protein [Nonomuraea rubra]MBB6556202.1 photosystem II stability/assembly factor-like uncharacterized protein [Nonomuraea rubra]